MTIGVGSDPKAENGVTQETFATPESRKAVADEVRKLSSDKDFKAAFATAFNFKPADRTFNDYVRQVEANPGSAATAASLIAKYQAVGVTMDGLGTEKSGKLAKDIIADGEISREELLDLARSVGGKQLAGGSWLSTSESVNLANFAPLNDAQRKVVAEGIRDLIVSDPQAANEYAKKHNLDNIQKISAQDPQHVEKILERVSYNNITAYEALLFLADHERKVAAGIVRQGPGPEAPSAAPSPAVTPRTTTRDQVAGRFTDAGSGFAGAAAYTRDIISRWGGRPDVSVRPAPDAEKVELQNKLTEQQKELKALQDQVAELRKLLPTSPGTGATPTPGPSSPPSASPAGGSGAAPSSPVTEKPTPSGNEVEEWKKRLKMSPAESKEFDELPAQKRLGYMLLRDDPTKNCSHADAIRVLSITIPTAPSTPASSGGAGVAGSPSPSGVSPQQLLHLRLDRAQCHKQW